MAELQSTEEAKESIHKDLDPQENNHDVESGSGSENGEKPVREQLKKTDLEGETQEGDGDPTTVPNGAATEEDTAKLTKKRSYEDLAHEDEAEPELSASNTHARKKTREASTPIQQSFGNTADHTDKSSKRNEASNHNDMESDKVIAPSQSSNEPMEDADSTSPAKIKKKRSAEEMSDFQAISKSPKVAATDLERSRRSTSASLSDNDSKSGSPESSAKTKADPARSVPQTEAGKSTHVAEPKSGGFANTSTVSPFASLSPSKVNKAGAETQPQTSSSAFNASGFASLASASSPFGALAKEKSPAPESQPQTSASAFAASGFGALTGTTSAFGTVGEKSKQSLESSASPFAAASAQTGFGSGVKSFGSGFGGGFGGGSKLSSFAAPVGDTKLGSAPKAKPFGAPADSDEEDGSDDEKDSQENDDDNSAFGDPTANTASQFKVQDDHITGEEEESTSFLANARLYHYVGGTGWVEKGSGPFKLNYKINEPSDITPPAPGSPDPFHHLIPGETEISARFLMRNAATYKVILSSGIFKDMKIGDRAGGEPEKKNEIFFSAQVEGKVTPHLLRMGKKDDSKELYNQVKKIQELLS